MIKAMISERRILPQSMLVLGVVVIAASLLMGFANYYKSKQDSLLADAEIAHNNAREKLQLSKHERQNIKHYLPKYQHLLQVGFIGEERRQEWVARLHQVGKQYHLFSIDYDIGQQTAFHSKFLLNQDHYKMHRSVMTLRWSLLHEDDFIHFLSGLREGSSPFMMRDCEIAVISDAEINDQVIQQNLKASCAIDWLTIEDSAMKASL